MSEVEEELAEPPKKQFSVERQPIKEPSFRNAAKPNQISSRADPTEPKTVKKELSQSKEPKFISKNQQSHYKVNIGKSQETNTALDQSVRTSYDNDQTDLTEKTPRDQEYDA